MYRRDQTEISKYALCGPDQMARVVTFVYLTIQQSITTLQQAMQDVDRHGVESKFLWGFKLGAYEWLQENKQDVYRNSLKLWYGHACPVDAEVETLQYFASLPGLGLVKGGFCNQLIFGTTGCIDTHNCNIFEVNPRMFRACDFKVASPKQKAKKARRYAEVCYDVGGSEFLWDNWCSYVAERNGRAADEISAIHTKAIVGRHAS